MAGKSPIEWTEQTWNPIIGCSIKSPGCKNCYAMPMAARIEAMNAGFIAKGKPPGAPHYDGVTKIVNGKPVFTGKLAQAPDAVLLAPLKRKKPTTYFVNSMGDLFHEDCPDEWIDKVFAVMALCPQHTFQVLTKRAGRMRDYFTQRSGNISPTGFRCPRINHILNHADRISRHDYPAAFGQLAAKVSSIVDNGYFPNVWLGVSTERQQEADERIPLLLQTPAAVRFISAEPLLGSVDLIGALARFQDTRDNRCAVPLGRQLIDWVICGGESGKDARPMHPAWPQSLRDQCAAAGVAFFFKQWGEWSVFYDRDRDDPDWRNLPQPPIDNQMGRGATRWHNLAGGIDEAQFSRRDTIAVTGLTDGQLKNTLDRELVVLASDHNPGTGRRRLFTGGDILKITTAHSMSAIGFPMKWSYLVADEVERRAANRLIGLVHPNNLRIVTFPRPDGDWERVSLYDGMNEQPQFPVVYQILEVDRLIDQVIEKLRALIEDRPIPNFDVPLSAPQHSPLSPENDFFRRWSKDDQGRNGFHGERLVAMRNVGKKAAGRHLDGVLHDAMPQADGRGRG